MKKVKITKVPSMAWGGRIFNQVAPNALPYQTDEDMMHYNDTLQPVSREEANLEAEKDEEVVMPNYKGMSAKFRVGGKRHSEGGTPLNLPDDSFVFSDTRAMKIKDPNILKAFGKPAKAGGYTPAELAKGYDINKYRKVLDNPMSDSIQKKTAEEMIANYNVLLGKLALAQESKKGFPQGIPFIAEPYLMMNKISAEDVLPMPEEQGMQGMQAPQQQMQMTKYGGYKKVRIKQLPQAQVGFQSPVKRTMDLINPNNYKLNEKGESEYKPQIENADVNSGQIIPPGSYFSDTDRNTSFDFLKPKSGIQAFAKRQVAKGLIGNIFGNENEKDPMLAYRTMEDTMTGIPTSKGTFDPLNKNNFPYKNDYATYDPFTYSAAYGGALPKGQYGMQPGATASDSLAHQMGKSLLYEGNRGSGTGQGLPNFGYNKSTLPNFTQPSTLDQALAYAQQEYTPKLVHYGSPTEKGEAFDFLYNTGKDPRKYALQEYYRQYEPTQLNKSGEWEGRKTVKDAELDKLYKEKVGKLKENDRRLMLNKGRDWYYKNTYSDKPGSNRAGVDYWAKTKTPDPNKQYTYDNSTGYYYERGADGSLSPAYGKSWYGRIWNTNDYTPFDAKNPKFTPKKKYGGDLFKAQVGVGVLAPQYLPSEDQAIADAMMSYLPGTQAAAANATAAANQQAAAVQQNVQAAQAPVAPAPVAAANTAASTAKPKAAKTATGTPTSKSSSSGDLISFNQDFWNEYDTLGQAGSFVYDVPGINFKDPKERERRATQAARKDKNIYGDLDWNKGDLMNDFTRRHQWYLKDHPDFDPTDMSDVKDFQTQYCSRAAAFGMKSCYFLEAGKSGTGFDGKFGEHTWSAPGFNTPEEQPAETEEPKQEEIKPVNVEQPPIYNPFEYYPQDVLNLMTAMGARIPDPQTFYSNLAWQGYSPAYVKEDYSPIMEAANIATQGIGAYGSRQSADASYSGIQGKAARQAADHNLQVANLNVGIYNDAEKFNAQTREKNYMYNQMQKQQNFDTEQAYAADRIKAKNEKRANVAALYNQMLTNAVDTYNLNIMNPNFKVLPGTGGMIDLINTDFLKPNKNALDSARLQEYKSLLAEGLTHDQAVDVMGRQTGKATYSQQQQYPYSNPYDYMTGLNYYEG